MNQQIIVNIHNFDDTYYFRWPLADFLDSGVDNTVSGHVSRRKTSSCDGSANDRFYHSREVKGAESSHIPERSAPPSMKG